MRSRKYHTIQIGSKECCIACVTTLCKYYKVNTKYKIIKSLLNCNINRYTTLDDINIFFNKIGIYPKYYKFNTKILNIQNLNFNKSQLPCLALIDIGSDALHYIVIYKIGKYKVTYSDPSRGSIIKENKAIIFKKIIYLIIFPDIENKIGVLNNDNLVNDKDDKFVWSIISDKKHNLLFLFLASIISASISMFLSFRIGVLVDIVAPSMENGYSLLYLFVFCMLILVLFQFLLELARKTVSILFSRNLEKDINELFFEKVLNIKLSDMRYLDTGDLLSRLGDGFNIVNILSNTLIVFLIDCIFMICALFAMFYVNVSIFIIIFLYVIFMGIVVFFNQKKIINKYYDSMNSHAKLNSSMVSLLEKMTDINYFNANNFFRMKVNNNMIQYISKAKEVDYFLRNYSGFQTLLNAVAELTVLVIGVSEVQKGSLSIGMFFSLLTISLSVFNSNQNFLRTIFEVNSFTVAIRRLSGILNNSNTDEAKNRILDEEIISELRFLNFSIRYNSKFILRNINLVLKEDFTIINGDSGAGKTTLANCLLKYEINYDGDIYVNGNNIKNFTGESLRSHILYISNDDFIIDATIYENLCLDMSIAYNDVLKVCKDLCILDLIMKLPNDFQYRLEEEGSNLSLGQKQRLIVARAVLKNPDFLILDESLSNVDSKSKGIILDNLRKYKIKFIYITHDNNSLYSVKKLKIKNCKIFEEEGENNGKCSI